MRPFSQHTSQDTRCIVFSCILFVLTVLNFYLADALASKTGLINENIILKLHAIPRIQYAVSALLLVNAAIALSAGITGLDKIYEAQIGLTILGIICSLTAGGYTIDHGLVRKYYTLCNTLYCRYRIWTGVNGLSMGLVAVNSFSLLFLTILSIDGFVSLNKRRTSHPRHQKRFVATVVHTDESYSNGSYPQELPQSYSAESPPQSFYPSEPPPSYSAETPPQCTYPSELPPSYSAETPPQCTYPSELPQSYSAETPPQCTYPSELPQSYSAETPRQCNYPSEQPQSYSAETPPQSFYPSEQPQSYSAETPLQCTYP